MDWRDDAACLEVPGDLFFPGDRESALPAKSICARCPVVAECLEYALTHNEHEGVWGNTTSRERRKLRRAS
jgi:WhiB family transcriptional regulator, redox-sensing transcriptional regulator